MNWNGLNWNRNGLNWNGLNWNGIVRNSIHMLSDLSSNHVFLSFFVYMYDFANSFSGGKQSLQECQHVVPVKKKLGRRGSTQ